MPIADDTVHGLILTHDASGPADADSDPGTVVYRNGTAAVVISPSITSVGTGRYRATWMIPDGWADGDDIHVIAVATIGGVVYEAPIPELCFVLGEGVPSAIATTLLGSVITGALTFRQMLVGIGAALFAKVTGGGTAYKDPGDNTTTRLTVADDGGGDRTVTQNL